VERSHWKVNSSSANWVILLILWKRRFVAAFAKVRYSSLYWDR